MKHFSPIMLQAYRARLWSFLQSPFGVTLLAAFVLSSSSRAVHLHADTIRDMLLARDCHELGRCHSFASSASAWDLTHGAGWTSLLALCLKFGLSARGIQFIIILFQSISAGLLFALVDRLHDKRAAWITTLAWTLTLVSMGDSTVLWNPSPTALPLILFMGCLVWLAKHGSLMFAGLAGFWTGILASMHIGFGALVPALLATTISATRHWYVGLLVTLAAMAAPIFGLSSGMLEQNWMTIREGIEWTILAFPLLVFLSLLLRRVWKNLNDLKKQALIAVTLIGTASIGLVVYRLSANHIPVRGMLPGAPTACMTLGWVASRFASRLSPKTLSRAPVLGFVVVISTFIHSLDGHSPTDRWTFDDVARIAPTVNAAKVSWEQLLLRTQGKDCWSLVGALGIHAPAPEPSPDKPSLAYRLLRFDSRLHDELAREDATLIPLDNTHTAAFQVARSRLLWDKAQVCILQNEKKNCTPLATALPEQVKPDEFLFGRRRAPETHDLPRVEPYVVEYEVAVTNWFAGEDWVLDVLDEREKTCAWSIVRTSFPHDEPLPTRTLRVHDAQLTGHIVLALKFEAQSCPSMHVRSYPPCLLETKPSEKIWRKAAGAGGVQP